MSFTSYPITQGFGPTNEPLDSGGFNKGYDFATPLGTPIEALVGGTVISAGDSGDGWGISVKVLDAQGNTHNYGHLSSVNVQPGQTIGTNTLLGASGNTGKSTGPHLSYDVWDANGGYFDPFGGGMPGQEGDSGDLGWWEELWDSDDGTDGGEDRNPLDEYTWTPEERTQFLIDAGLQWVSGNGPDAIWRMPDGDTISEVNAFTKLLSGSGGINVPAGSTSTAGAPPRVTSGGVTYERQPDGTWAPAQGIPPSGGTSSTSGGFTLSGGQTRYIPDGRGGYTAVQSPAESDPYAGIKLQQAQMDLQLKQQNLRFLQDKHSFEMYMGKEELALKTQGQIFEQKFAIQKLETDIQQFNARMEFDTQQANIQNERARQQQLQGLASDIGQLAADPGDRGAYASFALANSGWGEAANAMPAQDLRTQDSLMPLQALLMQRQDLMGQQPQVGVPPVSGINLGALTAPTANPAALPQPDLTPGYTTPTNVEGGQQPLAGPTYLNPDEIMAGAQWAPTQGFPQPTQMAGTGGINLQALMGPDGDLPLKAKGGMEDEAFIAGEKGPEIVIPLKGGKTAVLNEQQASSMGINLAKLTKMAAGGIFDGLIPNDTGDRGLATSFLEESTRRALSGTPWAGQGNVPGPVFGSSPAFDPLVLQLMASINAQKTGVPASAYMRQAALLKPAGVNESPIRRSA